jgi:hypothetical protein
MEEGYPNMGAVGRVPVAALDPGYVCYRAFCLVIVAAQGALLWFAVRPVVRRQHLRAEGRCLHCGYDLTGNVRGRCRECGAAGREGPVAEASGKG